MAVPEEVASADAVAKSAAARLPEPDPWETEQCVRHVGRMSSPVEEPAPAKPVADKRGQPAHGTSKPHTARPPAYDSWETEQRLRHIGRVLRPHIRPATKPAAEPKRKARVHAAHARTPGWHRKDRRQVPARVRQPSGDPGMAMVVWSAISLGVMLLACGGILLGWSVLGHRPELWSLGFPIAVAGQVILLFGLVIQLDRLWSHNRDAAAKLDAVDRQLHDLRSTTAMLGTTHSTPGIAFYSHMAGGASPQLLLADLKGQLDLLAMQMGKGEAAT